MFRPHALALDMRDDLTRQEIVPRGSLWVDAPDPQAGVPPRQAFAGQPVGGDFFESDPELVVKPAPSLFDRLFDVGRELLVGLGFDQRDRVGTALASWPCDRHVHPISRLAETDHLLQLPGVAHRLAVQLDDHIAKAQPCPLGRAVFAAVGVDAHAVNRVEPDVFRIIGRRVLYAHAEDRTRDPTGGDQLFAYGPRQVDRNREAVADV